MSVCSNNVTFHDAVIEEVRANVRPVGIICIVCAIPQVGGPSSAVRSDHCVWGLCAYSYSLTHNPLQILSFCAACLLCCQGAEAEPELEGVCRPAASHSATATPSPRPPIVFTDVHTHLKPIQKGEKEATVSSWPFVIVFPASAKERKEYNLYKVMKLLHNAGLQTCLYYSTDESEIFCRITCS